MVFLRGTLNIKYLRRELFVKSIQQYVIMFVSDGSWFSPAILIFSTNKTNRYVITEILLKVALNNTTLTLYFIIIFYGYGLYICSNAK